MVNRGLGEHGVVLELGLAEGRGVAGDEDELCATGAEGLDGGDVAEGDAARFHHQGEARGDGVGGLLGLWGHCCGCEVGVIGVMS